MNNQTYGALKRIIEEIKEYRKADCIIKNCILNDEIGGNDIDLVETWIIEKNKGICGICNKKEDEDGRCGCTNKDAQA